MLQKNPNGIGPQSGYILSGLVRKAEKKCNYSKNFLKMKNIFVLALCMLSFGAFAQKTKNTTANFWVAGACGMCETTIEKAVDLKGVVA